MKTIGWILLVIGVLSLIGAASAGDSVFGPLFFVSIGAYLLYRANNKDEEPKKSIAPKETKRDVAKESTTPCVQQESLEEVHSAVTTRQKEAAICLILFFAGADEETGWSDASQIVLHQACVFWGIDERTLDLKALMQRNSDATIMMDRVTSITHVKSKEFLLLSCWDIMKRSTNTELSEVFFNVAKNLGYDENAVMNLIKTYTF